jgi:hypothetical protein
LQKLRTFYHAAFLPHGSKVCERMNLPPTSTEQDEAEISAAHRAFAAIEPDQKRAITFFTSAFAEGFVHLLHGAEMDQEIHDQEIDKILAIVVSFYRGLVAVQALKPLTDADVRVE